VAKQLTLEVAERIVAAWTAAAMRAATRDLVPAVQPGAPVYAL
jgi:hypothetical protein